MCQQTACITMPKADSHSCSVHIWSKSTTPQISWRYTATYINMVEPSAIGQLSRSISCHDQLQSSMLAGTAAVGHHNPDKQHEKIALTFLFRIYIINGQLLPSAMIMQ